MYDPMVAKLIAWDVDREHATRRMLRALGEYEVGGLTTLIPFHKAILATEQWARGETCRDLMEDRDWLESIAPGGCRTRRGGRGHRGSRPRLQGRGLGQALRRKGDRRGHSRHRPSHGGKRPPKRERKSGGAAAASSETLLSPLQGTVLKVAVEQGPRSRRATVICVIEAMKMENEITARSPGQGHRPERLRGRGDLQRRRAGRHRVSGRRGQPAQDAPSFLAASRRFLTVALGARAPRQLLAMAVDPDHRHVHLDAAGRRRCRSR